MSAGPIMTMKRGRQPITRETRCGGRFRRRYHGATCAVVLAATLAGAAAEPGVEPPPSPAAEYQVKAEFLYNFAKYVEWPPDAFSHDDAFQVCVFGENPFDPALDQVLQGRT